MFSAVTGKRNMSKVSPGLGSYQEHNSGICHTTVNDSMVVKTSNSHRQSPGSNRWRNQTYSVLLQQSWRVETVGSGITRLCDGDVSWLLQNGEIEGVGTVELVCVGGLLRMGGESLLLPVWRSIGGGLTKKEELGAWLVRLVTWWPGNFHRMGAKWAGIGGHSTKKSAQST